MGIKERQFSYSIPAMFSFVHLSFLVVLSHAKDVYDKGDDQVSRASHTLFSAPNDPIVKWGNGGRGMPALDLG